MKLQVMIVIAMATFIPEMRLFDAQGQRLYLNLEERKRFLAATREEARDNRLYCHILHYTGCRPGEALELCAGSVLLEEKAIVFRILKKRLYDAQGKPRAPVYRTVDVPGALIEALDNVYDLRRA